MSNLINKLRELKSIQPCAGFTLRSRAVVTIAPQLHKTIFTHLRESLGYSLALGLGSLLLLTMLGRFSYLHFNSLSPVVIGSLQTKTLTAEEGETDFSLQIAEAKYFDETAGVVAVALQTVRDNNFDHLNSAILDSELQRIEKTKADGTTPTL